VRGPYFQPSNLSDERAKRRGLTEQLCVPLHTHNSGHMTTRRWWRGRGTMQPTKLVRVERKDVKCVCVHGWMHIYPYAGCVAF